MTSQKRWTITGDKFLAPEQIKILIGLLLERRDLAIVRQKNLQAIRDFYAVRALLETGVRVFEFCAITNADFQGRRLIVRRGKGNKARTVLLTRSTASMLKEWLVAKAQLGISLDPVAPMFPSRYGEPYSTRGVQKRIKLVFRMAALPMHLSVHSLRHTYCSMLLASGKVSIATVKENLGHHSIAVTNLYSHAVGDLTDVDLYAAPGSEKAELSELHEGASRKKPKSIGDYF